MAEQDTSKWYQEFERDYKMILNQHNMAYQRDVEMSNRYIKYVMGIDPAMMECDSTGITITHTGAWDKSSVQKQIDKLTQTKYYAPSKLTLDHIEEAAKYIFRDRKPKNKKCKRRSTRILKIQKVKL